MTKPLTDRLDEAGEALRDVEILLNQNQGKVKQDLENALGEIAAMRLEFPAWKLALGARQASRQYLDHVLAEVDAQDEVALGPSRIKFAHARLMGVDAYLAATWSVADRISAVTGRIVCVQKRGGLASAAKDAGLVGHFVKDQMGNEAGPSVLWHVLKTEYGWPVCVSYALRNHFIHDAAQLAAGNFFAGEVKAAGFKISAVGCDHLRERAKGYGVNDTMCSPTCTLSVKPNDDLTDILDASQLELDAALGFLMACATKMLRDTTGVMLGLA